jgi:methylglutaconyl-CoA hydratase
MASLDARVDEVVHELLSAGPTAARGAKAVIRDQRGLARRQALALGVDRAARQRVSPEGQEGLTAFLDKRPATWRRG